MSMEDQIILIDKPAGISSFGVVAKIRGRLKTKFGHKVKVGHTGTLDPFATGLLILLSGKMTKKSNEFLKLDKEYVATLKLGYTSTTGDPEKLDKEYVATLKLGYTSTTGDPEGEITEYIQSTKPVKIEEHKDKIYDFVAEGAKQCDKISDLSHCEASEIDGFCALSDIQLTLDSFIGKIRQTPPKFSAIKINGQRAYKLAREGKDFEIPSREVEIYSIEILNYSYPELTIRVHCSSGTYIRTLAEDIGKTLGTGAYLTTLRRIKIGSYDIKDAEKLVL